MKTYPSQLDYVLLFSAILLACFGCAKPVPVPDTEPLQPELIVEEAEVTELEESDPSCSYFYFLWGTHAENNRRYPEAEEAYEKALICDPESRYILQRLPILLIRMDKPGKAAQRLRENIKRYPDELQDRLLLARLDVRSGEIDEAITLYKEIIRLSPGDETSLLRLGTLYSQQNREMEAEHIFKQALDLNPQSLFAHLYLARLAAHTGDISQAGRWYRAALDLNWSTELALEVADFHGSQKDYPLVEQQYREILEHSPEDMRAALGLVHTLILQDKENAALEELQRLRQLSSDPNQIDIITARLYLRSENHEKASELLEPLVLQGDEHEAAYMLAIIRYQQKELVQALELLKTISGQSSSYEDSIYLRVRILLDQKNGAEAAGLLEEVLSSGLISDPALYSLLASLYMEQDRVEEGYAVLDRALAEYPDNPTLHFEYGLFLEEQGQQEQAIVHMQRVLELDSDHAEALNYIGYTWADRNINLDRALQYIERAMALKPGNGYIQDSLAWIYFRLGNLDRARTEIMKALELEPTDPHIYEHLGDIYRAQGNTEKARKAYNDAKELFRDEAAKTRIRDKLDELR